MMQVKVMAVQRWATRQPRPRYDCPHEALRSVACDVNRGERVEICDAVDRVQAAAAAASRIWTRRGSARII